MLWWLGLAVLAVFALLVAAMWMRPDPNHTFALDMLNLLADEEPEHQSESPGVLDSGKLEIRA